MIGQDPTVGPPPDALGGVVETVGELFGGLLFLPEQASDFAVGADWLQYGQFVGFWLVGIALFGATAWFLVRYRRTEDGPVRTRRVTAPLWMEVGIVAVLLSFFVLGWVIGFRQWVAAEGSAGEDAYEVYVTGRQWMWHFEHPEGRSTAGVLHLPLGRRVRLLVTSRDVIHSFFVPEFRIKKDAVPGRYNAVSFTPTRPGTYRGMCAEFCGTAHSRMWADVRVLEPEAFERWLETGRTDEGEGAVAPPDPLLPGDPVPEERESLARRGRRAAAELGCLGCHTVDGSRHLAPTWLGLFGSREVMESGDTVRVDAGYVTESMMRPQERIVRGFPPIMPSFQGRIDPARTAAIIEYMRSLSGDGAPDVAPGGDG